MPEKTFKEKAQKYKNKYYAAVQAKKEQTGGNIAQMSHDPAVSANTFNNMIAMVGGDVETPDNLDYFSD